MQFCICYFKYCICWLSIAAIAGSASGSASVFGLPVNTEFSDHVKIRFISQLIDGMSSVLQKLLKCFNGTTVSTSFSVMLPSNFPVILVLQSKDLESLIEQFMLLFAPLFQARNQEFFGVGEVSWNGGHFNKRFLCDTRRKGPAGKNVGLFSLKCSKNYIFSENLNPKMHTNTAHFSRIRAPFWKIRTLFFYF